MQRADDGNGGMRLPSARITMERLQRLTSRAHDLVCSLVTRAKLLSQRILRPNAVAARSLLHRAQYPAAATRNSPPTVPCASSILIEASCGRNESAGSDTRCQRPSPLSSRRLRARPILVQETL